MSLYNIYIYKVKTQWIFFLFFLINLLLLLNFVLNFMFKIVLYFIFIFLSIYYTTLSHIGILLRNLV